MKITDEYVFFYKECFSNFHKCNIKEIWEGKTITFTCSEQYFMWHKAIFFNDTETAEKILAETRPINMQKLGRAVRGYSDQRWAGVRVMFMIKSNYLKYSQNDYLRQELLSDKYKGKHFVEASPIDHIWGIGMDENNPLCENKDKWQGDNLLGQCLDIVRDMLE